MEPAGIVVEGWSYEEPQVLKPCAALYEPPGEEQTSGLLGEGGPQAFRRWIRRVKTRGSLTGQKREKFFLVDTRIGYFTGGNGVFPQRKGTFADRGEWEKDGLFLRVRKERLLNSLFLKRERGGRMVGSVVWILFQSRGRSLILGGGHESLGKSFVLFLGVKV